MTIRCGILVIFLFLSLDTLAATTPNPGIYCQVRGVLEETYWNICYLIEPAGENRINLVPLGPTDKYWYVRDFERKQINCAPNEEGLSECRLGEDSTASFNGPDTFVFKYHNRPTAYARMIDSQYNQVIPDLSVFGGK